MRFGNGHPAVGSAPRVKGGLGNAVFATDRLDGRFAFFGLVQDGNDLLLRERTLLDG